MRPDRPVPGRLEPLLRLEVGDAAVGSGEFAGAVLQLALELGEAVCGLAVRLDLLAQPVDLTGPAGLVVFLAVLGEGGALERPLQLGPQFRDLGGQGIGGGYGVRRGACRGGRSGFPQQPVDAGDTKGRAVAALQLLTQTHACEHGVPAAELGDERQDLFVGQARGAGITE